MHIHLSKNLSNTPQQVTQHLERIEQFLLFCPGMGWERF